MNTFQTLRAGIKAALTSAGMTVEDHLPERVNPPLAILVAGSPYVESGDTYGAFHIRFTIVLVVPRGPNKVVTDALDETVAAALVALDAHGVAVERVDQPTMLQHANTEFLSTMIDVLCPGEHIDDGRTD